MNTIDENLTPEKRKKNLIKKLMSGEVGIVICEKVGSVKKFYLDAGLSISQEDLNKMKDKLIEEYLDLMS